MGVAVLALVTGLCGGIIRDVLLDFRPVAFQDSAYLVVALVAGLAGFLLASHVGRRRYLLVALEGAFLAVFVVAGATKAERAGLAGLAVVAIGVIASTGGGVVRDLLAGMRPLLIQPGTFTALSPLAGAVTFVTLGALDVPLTVRGILAAAMTFGARVGSVRLGWTTTAVRPPTRRRRQDTPDPERRARNAVYMPSSFALAAAYSSSLIRSCRRREASWVSLAMASSSVPAGSSDSVSESGDGAPCAAVCWA